MRLQLLNECLSTSTVLTAAFPFDPIILPINKDFAVVAENSATQKHFSTIVFVKELHNFCIFEFNQKLLDGLLAYRQRYGGMSKFEIILSRSINGEIIMTLGANNLLDYDIDKTTLEEGRAYHDKLYFIYKNKQNYIVHDAKGKV